MTVNFTTLKMAQQRARGTFKDRNASSMCCGCSRRTWANGVGVFELMVATVGIVYTMLDIYYFPQLLPKLSVHDELYAEAKIHAHKVPVIPKGLLYWDLFLYCIEFVLAITLLYGISEPKPSRIRHWMAYVVTYNVILTGIFLGFIIGGISSSRLNYIGFLYSFFRFLEVAIVYEYYQELSDIRKAERLLRDNNNTLVPIVIPPNPDYGAQQREMMAPFPV